MTKTTTRALFGPQVLAIAAALGFTAHAEAVSFNIGEVEAQLDSSLSIGMDWGLRNADPALVGTVNGGRGQASTGDDGRLNFRKDQVFSKRFTGTHDLELKYGDTGVFVRGKYWYDFELEDGERDFKPIGDHDRQEADKSSGAEILDAYIYHNYAIGDLPGTVRFGKQVVSWGESTFIGNSINSINPIDESAFHRPATEIKDGLVPVNMLYVSQGLTDALSVEAFYQLEWDQNVVENCGTFFSSDVLADGCTSNYTVGSPAIKPLEPVAAALGQGFQVADEGVVVPRGSDRDPSNAGQWGTALHWLDDDTEYGVYFMNYHSRQPMLSTRTASQATVGSIPSIIAAANSLVAGSGSSLAQSTLFGNGEYYLEYPQDIHLFGASFSTTLPAGTIWRGEISYRPNAPVQLNTTDLTQALLNPITGGTASPIASSAGSDNTGYRRKEITQLQSTLTQIIDQVLGAERLTLVGEAAVVHVGGLEPTSELRYGRDPVYGAYGNGDTGGFVTATSWGYRARATLDYNNVIARVNLKPNLSWSQDVNGYGPNGLFNEGAKAISVGVDADYLNTYTASLSYTDFFGGDYNTLVDRGFVSLSVGVSF